MVNHQHNVHNTNDEDQQTSGGVILHNNSTEITYNIDQDETTSSCTTTLLNDHVKEEAEVEEQDNNYFITNKNNDLNSDVNDDDFIDFNHKQNNLKHNHSHHNHNQQQQQQQQQQQHQQYQHQNKIEQVKDEIVRDNIKLSNVETPTIPRELISPSLSKPSTVIKMVRFKKDINALSGSGNVTRMELESEEEDASSSSSLSSLDENEFLESVVDETTLRMSTNPYERILNYCNKLKVDAQIYRRELMLTSSYLLCFVSLGISVGSLGPTLLSLSNNTNSTLDQVGYFFSARGLGYFLGSFSGRFYDRVPNGNLLCGASVLLMAVALFFVPLFHNIWITGLVFFFNGGFAGLIDSGLNTMIVWIWQEKVNPFMQLLHFAFGVGALLAPFLVSLMIQSSLFTQYLVLAIIIFVAGVPILLLPPVKPDNLSTDQESQEVVSKNEKRLRFEVVIAVSIFLFFYVGAEAGYGGWIYTYSKLNLNFEDQAAALLNSLFWTSFTISRLAGVFISMVLTPHQMVVMDILGCLFFSFLLVLFNNSSVILIIATAGIGISQASLFPTCFSLPRNLDMPVSGESTSFMVIGAVAGEISIPWIIGVCQHRISMYSLPWIVIVTISVSAFIYVGIVVRAKLVRASDRGERLELNLRLLNIADIKSPNLFKSTDPQIHENSG